MLYAYFSSFSLSHSVNPFPSAYPLPLSLHPSLTLSFTPCLAQQNVPVGSVPCGSATGLHSASTRAVSDQKGPTMTHPNASGVSSNISGLDSSGNFPRPFSVFSVLALTLLAMLVVATFVWNLLVLLTILRVRTFHRVPHNLVASMAISDVMVAALVMPLSLVHELNGRLWKLGRVLCQVWISFDVLCCTASIWNVTAIALDRYWSITRHLEYTLKTRKRISNVMIALTWLLSSVI